jgi:NADPH:quinone reductase-like Zn-dependent oxidoreductase
MLFLKLWLTGECINAASRLLSELMALVDKGHVKPISPITVFPFEDIVSAFRYLRSGGHIGKVVISNGLTSSVEVPVKLTTEL